MLRFLIGYLIGAGIGFFLCATFIQLEAINLAAPFVFFVSLFVIILIIGLIWSHNHHVKKRKDYYRKINN